MERKIAKRFSEEELKQIERYGTFNFMYIHFMNELLLDILGNNSKLFAHNNNNLNELMDSINDASEQKPHTIKVLTGFNLNDSIETKPYVYLHFERYALIGKSFSGGLLNVNQANSYLDLSNQNLLNLNLSGCDLTNVNFFKAYCVGLNLTGATLPTAINTKETFKAFVGAWDETTTIWTDGEAIGADV